MDIYCMVTPTGLVPMYDSDYDEKKKLKVGERVLCSIKKPRNYEFHKKYFALLRLTYDNLPERLEQMMSISDFEDLRKCIMLDLGYAHAIWHEGKRYIEVDSIAFSNMDETEFQTLYNRTIDIILTKYLRGLDLQTLLDEVEKFK